MKKYKSSLIIFFALVLVAASVLVVFFILKDRNTKNNHDNQTNSAESFKDFTSKANGSYKQFSFKYPGDWQTTKDASEPVQPVYSFSKGDYKLVVTQIEGDGAECVFNSDFDPEMADFYVDISKYQYETIGSVIGNFYYYGTEDGNEGEKNYTFCGPGLNQHDKPFILTALGVITLTTPSNTDPSIMKEMAGIISSAKINNDQ